MSTAPAAAASTNRVVTLNIGGKHVEVNFQTLCAPYNGLLRRIFCDGRLGQQADVRDSCGRIFIDRSPEAFGVVLEYLRTGDALVPREVHVERAQRELDYYFDEPPVASTCGMLCFERTSIFARHARRFLAHHIKDDALQLLVDGDIVPRPVTFAFVNDKHIGGWGTVIVTLAGRDVKYEESLESHEPSLFAHKSTLFNITDTSILKDASHCDRGGFNHIDSYSPFDAQRVLARYFCADNVMLTFPNYERAVCIHAFYAKAPRFLRDTKAAAPPSSAELYKNKCARPASPGRGADIGY